MTENTIFFLIKEQQGGIHKIIYDELLFVKSVGNYLQFYTLSGVVTIHGALLTLATILATDQRFIQVHRSYLVNLNHITHIDQKKLTIRTHEIPIGNKYMDGLKTVYILPNLIKL